MSSVKCPYARCKNVEDKKSLGPFKRFGLLTFEKVIFSACGSMKALTGVVTYHEAH